MHRSDHPHRRRSRAWLPSAAALALWAASAPALAAQRPAPPKPPPPLNRAALGAALRKELGGPALRKARVGVVAFDLIDREMVFTHEPDALRVVASNNKLFTTAAALELLGADFQFRTTVSAWGKVAAGGLLRGSLVVVGRGDPNISGRFHKGKATAVLEQWAAAVAEAGIKRVRGGVVADATYFDRMHTHPDWPRGSHAAWYCAPTGALSFNDNCVSLIVQPSKTRGALAVCSTVPATGYVRIVNSCRTTMPRRGAHKVVVHRRLGSNQLLVSGRIRQKAPPVRAPVTVHDPALYTATVFREVLIAKGIEVGGPARVRTPDFRIDPADCAELVTTTSSLADSVAVANTRSQNFYAEQILKTLGREHKGKGTFRHGAAAVGEFLRQAKIRGTYAYRDGSGLAPGNRFTPRQVAALLAYMNCRRAGTLFWRSLAEPGKAGTLLRRHGLRPLQGRLFAKTGYIQGVSALSGYLEARTGRLLAFAILVNDFKASLGEVRAAQDRICLLLDRYQP